MSNSRKTGLCFAGMVVVAGLLGVLAGLHIARAQLNSRSNLENWNQHVSQEFDRLVKPTPEQGERLAVQLNQAVTELEAIRAETIARSTNVIWRLIAQVEQELVVRDEGDREEQDDRPARGGGPHDFPTPRRPDGRKSSTRRKITKPMVSL